MTEVVCDTFGQRPERLVTGNLITLPVDKGMHHLVNSIQYVY